MRKGRFSEEQTIGSLREQEAVRKTVEVCRWRGISEATFYQWRVKFGGLGVSEAKRLRALEDENARLKKLLVEATLDSAVLKDISAKRGGASRRARDALVQLPLEVELLLAAAFPYVAAKIVSESHFLNDELSLNCLNSSVWSDSNSITARSSALSCSMRAFCLSEFFMAF